MSNRQLSVSNSCEAPAEEQVRLPDVSDVPDLILEALHAARTLRAEAQKGTVSAEQITALAVEIEGKLQPALHAMARAVDQLLQVA